MIPSISQLRERLARTLQDKAKQGYIVDGLSEKLSDLPDSYDALVSFAHQLTALELRPDWPYIEPNDWAGIREQLHPERPLGQFRGIAPEEAAARIETAFLSSVCGCVLGKPLEVSTDLAHIREAAQQVGDWPLNDYVRAELLDVLGKRHSSWTNTVRDRISFVEPDDDVNYTLIGMLVLERYGTRFEKSDLRDIWLQHLPLGTKWGPERTMLARAGVNHLSEWKENFEKDPSAWADFVNPGSELCGAQIRADAYGYACVGNPELAAELAWRDASWTHRKNGIYATMWTAAAIAVAPVAKKPLEIFEIANQFVPQKSRFYEVVSWALERVRESTDWLECYDVLRQRLGEYEHCHIYFESATLINTLYHAKNIGDGFCKQVMQGNDTDSYGATSGSIPGAYFGPGHLESRWLEPFNDDIHTALCWFYERSLSTLAKRIAKLPAQIAAELEANS